MINQTPAGKILEFLMDRYHNILKQIIYSSPYIIDFANSLRITDRRILWKGLILNRLLKGSAIKNYVQEKLSEMNFDKDITLEKFYRQS